MKTYKTIEVLAAGVMLHKKLGGYNVKSSEFPTISMLNEILQNERFYYDIPLDDRIEAITLFEKAKEYFVLDGLSGGVTEFRSNILQKISQDELVLHDLWIAGYWPSQYEKICKEDELSTSKYIGEIKDRLIFEIKEIIFTSTATYTNGFKPYIEKSYAESHNYRCLTTTDDVICFWTTNNNLIKYLKTDKQPVIVGTVKAHRIQKPAIKETVLNRVMIKK